METFTANTRKNDPGILWGSLFPFLVTEEKQREQPKMENDNDNDDVDELHLSIPGSRLKVQDKTLGTS